MQQNEGPNNCFKVCSVSWQWYVISFRMLDRGLQCLFDALPWQLCLSLVSLKMPSISAIMEYVCVMLIFVASPSPVPPIVAALAHPIPACWFSYQNCCMYVFVNLTYTGIQQNGGNTVSGQTDSTVDLIVVNTG